MGRLPSCISHCVSLGHKVYKCVVLRDFLKSFILPLTAETNERVNAWPPHKEKTPETEQRNI